ncbi:MAG: SDR family oxidoreductase [Rhodothermia bacterium]|nr:SDR family oxidoreductase [Rhodothermia bacterium]
MNIADSIVIITGASAGLGLECARQLCSAGATVYGLARRKERLQDAAEELGSRFKPVACDVTNEQSVRDAFATVLNDSGRIDVLINNAGLGSFGPVDELSIDAWNTMMDTNLRGVFLATRAVVPAMKKQNETSGFGGHIVNIASVAGLLGNPSISAYNATKFGVRGFSDAMMKELRGDGIKVTCVYPGSIETEFFEVAGVDISPNPMTAKDVASTILHVIGTGDNYLVSEVVMRPLRPRG